VTPLGGGGLESKSWDFQGGKGETEDAQGDSRGSGSSQKRRTNGNGVKRKNFCYDTTEQWGASLFLVTQYLVQMGGMGGGWLWELHR